MIIVVVGVALEVAGIVPPVKVWIGGVKISGPAGAVIIVLGVLQKLGVLTILGS